ncbi:alpha/beta fold hydrolase [Cellulomonas sp. NPDC055163]
MTLDARGAGDVGTEVAAGSDVDGAAVHRSERTLGVDGRPVGYTVWGRPGDAPPVLLLHGVTDSAETWDPVARLLAAERLVVGVDARGHGRTPLGEGPFTIASLAADAAAVLRHVADGPALVVGHSMGGLVATELTLTEPGLIAGLVLEDPAWDTGGVATPDGVPPFLAPFLLSFAGVDAETLEARSRATQGDFADDEHGPWARSKAQLDQRLVHVPHVWDGREWVGALAEVRVPVTLVTGDVGRGALVGSTHVERARTALGEGLTHVAVPGVGHSVRREGREAFLAAVEGALGRV